MALPSAFRSVTVPTSILPVVITFWLPKLGLIFVPAIAADALTSALTIVPSAILADVTELSISLAVLTVLSLGVPIPTLEPMVIKKPAAPDAGAAEKMMSAPLSTNLQKVVKYHC